MAQHPLTFLLRVSIRILEACPAGMLLLIQSSPLHSFYAQPWQILELGVMWVPGDWGWDASCKALDAENAHELLPRM